MLTRRIEINDDVYEIPWHKTRARVQLVEDNQVVLAMGISFSDELRHATMLEF